MVNNLVSYIAYLWIIQTFLWDFKLYFIGYYYPMFFIAKTLKTHLLKMIFISGISTVGGDKWLSRGLNFIGSAQVTFPSTTMLKMFAVHKQTDHKMSSVSPKIPSLAFFESLGG